MQSIDGRFRLSASDLMRFKGCRHATTLDLRKLEIGDLEPDVDGEEAALLQAQGDAHELAFLERLKADGRQVVEIETKGRTIEDCVASTLEAMRSGADVIFQGAMLDGVWGGYSDFLEKVGAPSELGEWSYEVVDTKLKRRPDPKHVLQLCLYSDMLADMQGRPPEHAYLELGDGSRFTVRLDEVSAYARRSRRMLQQFIDDRPATSPEPVTACALCRWKSHCEEVWRETDSLSLVANATRSQRDKLREAGIGTMTDLAQATTRIPRMTTETWERLRTQAGLQVARRAGGDPDFVLRDQADGRGFDLLPEPDEGDLFYDIEGDPYYPDGGLEYLHGIWMLKDGDWDFVDFWAHDRSEEAKLTHDLLDFLSSHMRAHPKAHIYHYANYEIAALRRLTSQHRTGEAAMDQLQRERRFVDLFKVVAGGLIASEKGYSIKDLEAFYMAKRDDEVATAGASVVAYEEWRRTRRQEILDEIRDYNRTDCISTKLLRDWLVSEVRPDGPYPVFGDTPGPKADEKVQAEEEEDEALRERLVPVGVKLGEDVATLLLDLSRFHQREDKPAYWAIFDRLAQDSEDLLDDLECLQGLEATGPAIKDKRSFEREYRFPEQETKLRVGKTPCVKPATMPEGINLVALDEEARTVVLRRSTAKGPLPNRLDLLPPRPIDNRIVRKAMASTTERIIAGDPRASAIVDLLSKTHPRIDGVEPGAAIVAEGGDLVEGTIEAIGAMRDVALVGSGRRVAVSSNSHRAIGNLLKGVAEEAEAQGVDCRIAQKVSDPTDAGDHPAVQVVRDNEAAEIAAADVVGATSWHFARYEDAAFDHLVIDEAGQVSLANVTAMSRAARNIVLVGDPMQLPQPIQGAHPGESGLSSLEYLIGDQRTVPADRGIFLPTTRRLHDDVCAFISRAVYEGRLENDDAASAQSLVGPDGTDLAGARIVDVRHEGRSQVSPEEVERVQTEIEAVSGARYVDRNGELHVVRSEDVIVVAPFNAQVNALRSALGADVKVGTVDLFQGQEAPVCIVSMTTSDGEEIPRGVEFLFSLNRINVAVSRAKVAARVIASPSLLDTPVRTVEQMKLVNTLCLLEEHGQR
jgi:predicted RecB family nuclease